jgi:ferrochelatase
MNNQKIAIVLFNLGGPDKPEAVKPFLFNLFNDHAIIRLPKIPRYLLAKLISSRRAPKAIGIYNHIGGRSPIVPETEKQANALKQALQDTLPQVEIFIAMRYWHPFTEQVVEDVKKYNPDKIILLPLYPQFSTTTSASSFKLWDEVAARSGLKAESVKICCHFEDEDFINAYASLIKDSIQKLERSEKFRVLFSAHGLPEKIVKEGDPYQWQVEQTSNKIAAKLELKSDDFAICYQSRVGPLKWIGPSTEHEIDRAGKDGVAIILAPIAFVSEHSETLVELDIEYAELAHEKGVANYIRVPAVADNQHYIKALKAAVINALEAKTEFSFPRICSKEFCGCMNTRAGV